MYTRIYFYIFIVWLNTRTSMIKTNLFSILLIFTATRATKRGPGTTRNATKKNPAKPPNATNPPPRAAAGGGRRAVLKRANLSKPLASTASARCVPRPSASSAQCVKPVSGWLKVVVSLCCVWSVFGRGWSCLVCVWSCLVGGWSWLVVSMFV